MGAEKGGVGWVESVLLLLILCWRLLVLVVCGVMDDDVRSRLHRRRHGSLAAHVGGLSHHDGVYLSACLFCSTEDTAMCKLWERCVSRFEIVGCIVESRMI